MGPARREHTRDIFERGAWHDRSPPPREEAVGRRVPARGGGVVVVGSAAPTPGPRAGGSRSPRSAGAGSCGVGAL